MAAGDLKGAADQLNLKAIHFVIKRDAARQVNLCSEALAAGLRRAALRVEYLFAQVFAAQFAAARDDDGALDNVLKLADVAGPGVSFERR